MIVPRDRGFLSFARFPSASLVPVRAPSLTKGRPLMVRARFAALAVAAGLGLLSGCSSLSRMNPFHRHPDACPCEGAPCDGDGHLGTDGPVLDDFPGGPVPPVPPGPVVSPGG